MGMPVAGAAAVVVSGAVATAPLTTTTAAPATGMPTTTTSATKKEVKGIVQMTFNSEMLKNETVMETLTNATADKVAEKAGVNREFVSVEVSEDRRLQSGSSENVTL